MLVEMGFQLYATKVSGVTNGFRIRRWAIDHDASLITDNKECYSLRRVLASQMDTRTTRTHFLGH